MKHRLRNCADLLVRIVQSSSECLISSQVSLVLPFQGKQEQRILVSSRGGSFRQRGFRKPRTCQTIASPSRAPFLRVTSRFRCVPWHAARLRCRIALPDRQSLLIATTFKWSANALHCLGKSPDSFLHHWQIQVFADVKGITILSHELPSNSR